MVVDIPLSNGLSLLLGWLLWLGLRPFRLFHGLFHGLHFLLLLGLLLLKSHSLHLFLLDFLLGDLPLLFLLSGFLLLSDLLLPLLFLGLLQLSQSFGQVELIWEHQVELILWVVLTPWCVEELLELSNLFGVLVQWDDHAVELSFCVISSIFFFVKVVWFLIRDVIPSLVSYPK